MRKFFQENFVVIAGVSLPLALALVFFLATKIGAAGIDPPRTSVIYARNYYENQGNQRYVYKVQEGNLHVYYQPTDPKAYVTVPSLHIFDPVSGEVRDIVPPDSNSPTRVELDVPELKNIRISAAQTSPDGFVFDADYRSHGNLMTEIFGGGGYRRYTVTLRKNGYRMPIPDSQIYSDKFIGWIVQDGQ